ncbi:MAG TPA: PAS domain S-box protein [Steroidobacter sp.]|nr:PAS domain S-box protein [Steroidobacter sp.]
MNPAQQKADGASATAAGGEVAALALKHAPLRQLLAALPQFALVLDRSLRILIANRGMGMRSPEQLEGGAVTDCFPKTLHPTALASMQRVLATGQVDGFRAAIDENGELRHFEVRVTPILEGDSVAALALIATEITDQIRAERAIATQAGMIESMLEGVAVIDDQGLIEITNPAFDGLFGYRRGELIGREMAALAGWPFEQRERWQLDPQDASASLPVEFDGRSRDGEHFAAQGVLSKFEVAGRNHSLLVLQDVSERKQLERAILEAVNREQYRIGNDLHDGLGQELTGVALMLRSVAGRLTAEYPSILPDVEGIMRLVNNAIESTRALARGLSPVNLERGRLQDALEGLAMHASEIYGVRVLCTYRGVAADPLNPELANHLYRIAQEAVRNSVRHGRARSIRLHLHGARAKVRLTITDDGEGLPEHPLDGHGMGLKIMSYRARMLGGDLRFERTKPQGTRVVCECPIASGAPRAARQPPRNRRRA